MAKIQADPNLVAPTEFARFERIRGKDGAMWINDEYIVHMPGPWNGPVRIAEVAEDSFRLVTSKDTLEAGQIEFRVLEDDDLVFQIESWARSGDVFSSLPYDRLRMAKEIQLHMWDLHLRLHALSLQLGKKCALTSFPVCPRESIVSEPSHRRTISYKSAPSSGNHDGSFAPQEPERLPNRASRRSILLHEAALRR